MILPEDIAKAIEEGKIRQTRELVTGAVAEGCSAGEILNGGLLVGLKAMGRRFSRNTGMVSDMLASARAINEGLAVLRPLLVPRDGKYIGRACIGTVQGDLHDVGKNVVGLLLESRGIEVIDLGVDVAPREFVRAVEEEHCELVCCSALLSATAPGMKKVVDALKAAGLRERVLVMVGGVPVNAGFCRRVGADIYTADAFAAADTAVEALQKRKQQREAAGNQTLKEAEQ